MRQDSNVLLNHTPKTYEEELLDLLDDIVWTLRESQVISQESNEILAENQKTLKAILEALYKINFNTS